MKLSNDTKLFLGQLRAEPKFKHVMKELVALRPVIPAFSPQDSQEANQHLLEQIKYDAGRKAGFDLVFLLLTGERTDG